MKTKLTFFAFLIIFSLSVAAQTKQDTTVTIETISGGKFSGQVISETGDSIKIKTTDLGYITIAKKEMVRYNLFTLETVDGNEFLGEIISEDSQSIKINNKTYSFTFHQTYHEDGDNSYYSIGLILPFVMLMDFRIDYKIFKQ